MKQIFYVSALIFLTFSCAPQHSVATNNLLDSDLDGVHDRRDACPNEPGSLFNLGCPEDKTMKLSQNFDEVNSTDSDLDGVPDDKDECPNQYGSPFNQGCPFMIKLD
ncbi:thrombospondin type 3 repeat-containing protein [Moheibacter sp.]|uniref:thrombospondin type 3 repeat-containing protein n=1 Tax=Moheibacter sp. TaxID=1965316 RepID=UPI003C7588E5